MAFVSIREASRRDPTNRMIEATVHNRTANGPDYRPATDRFTRPQTARHYFVFPCPSLGFVLALGLLPLTAADNTTNRKE
jgi:hypothetical protein